MGLDNKLLPESVKRFLIFAGHPGYGRYLEKVEKHSENPAPNRQIPYEAPKRALEDRIFRIFDCFSCAAELSKNIVGLIPLSEHGKGCY